MRSFILLAVFLGLALAEDYLYLNTYPCSYHIVRKNETGDVVFDIKGYYFEDYPVRFALAHIKGIDDDGHMTETIERSDLANYGGCARYFRDDENDCFKRDEYDESCTYFYGFVDSGFRYSNVTEETCPNSTQGCKKYCNSEVCIITDGSYSQRDGATVLKYGAFDITYDDVSPNDVVATVCEEDDSSFTLPAPPENLCSKPLYKKPELDCLFSVDVSYPYQGVQSIKGLISSEGKGYFVLQSEDLNATFRCDIVSDSSSACYTVYRDISWEEETEIVCWESFSYWRNVLPSNLFDSIPYLTEVDSADGKKQVCFWTYCATFDEKGRIVRGLDGTNFTYHDDALPSLSDFAVTDCDDNEVPAPTIDFCKTNIEYFYPEKQYCFDHYKLTTKEGTVVVEVEAFRSYSGGVLRVTYANGTSILVRGDETDDSDTCFVLRKGSGDDCRDKNNTVKCEPYYSVIPYILLYDKEEEVKCPDGTDGCTQYCLGQECFVADDDDTILEINDMIVTYIDDVPSLDTFADTTCSSEEIPGPEEPPCMPMFWPSVDLGCAFHVVGSSQSTVVFDAIGMFDFTKEAGGFVRINNSGAIVVIRTDVAEESKSDCISIIKEDDGTCAIDDECDDYIDYLFPSFEYYSSRAITCPKGFNDCRELCNEETCVTVDGQGRYVKRDGITFAYLDDHPTLEDFAVSCKDGPTYPAPKFDYCNPKTIKPVLPCAFHIVGSLPDTSIRVL